MRDGLILMCRVKNTNEKRTNERFGDRPRRVAVAAVYTVEPYGEAADAYAVSPYCNAIQGSKALPMSATALPSSW
jgi:hypothetical protein